MSTPTQPAPGREAPEIDYTQEVRFAVVMYGGSSLAIYINGVAQELFRLVRATAPKNGDTTSGRAHVPDAELTGTERVYRKLGRILERGKEATDDSGLKDGSPIRTRFVIDILTGTSAGGINAVFLAKALVNDQGLDELKSLWVKQGDVDVLLNDSKSVKGLKLDKPNPPGSLLNSQRMYYQLLDALRSMDRSKPSAKREGAAEAPSPYADELDLYVTATDMAGRILRLRLADDVVPERRHRNVFQFRYHTKHAAGEHRNDFEPEFNPFLAFAARCTSAHPAAFEPMRLSDVENVLRNYPSDLGKEYGPGHKELERFIREYLPTAEEGESPDFLPFQNRDFNDGGVLDNSPFSFASDALPFRHADAPVDRKLIYIEPAPEHPEAKKKQPGKKGSDGKRNGKPDFVSNALLSLTSLPRYQTIVEDIVRLLERNRLIERVSHITMGMESDWRLVYGGEATVPPTRDEFLKLDEEANREKLKAWIRQKGLAWGSYQRLRAADVTDDLALLVARAAGLDEESDEFLAVRYLVRAWRKSRYDPHFKEGKESELKFLILFDLLWTMRRVRFLLTKLNDISCLDDHAKHVVAVPFGKEKGEVWLPEEELDGFRRTLLGIKRQLNEAYTYLRAERRRLWSRGEDNPFRELVGALEVSSKDLVELLRRPTDEARLAAARGMLARPLNNKSAAEAGGTKTRGDALVELTREVERTLEGVINNARAMCRKALGQAEKEGDERPQVTAQEELAHKVLRYYYRHFEDYDMVSFPILYSTDVGEELDTVEVFRISPEDARRLIDEKTDNLRHLAGTTLGNFGAFFEEQFRHNDITWGRLDGAERIIHALLPKESQRELRNELIDEAHRAIIIEEKMARDLKPKDKVELRRLVEEELARMGEKGKGRELAGSLAARLEGSGVNPSLKSFLHSFLETSDPRDTFIKEFKESYAREREFTPERTLRSAARASRVVGKMLEGYAEANKRQSKAILWFARVTRWFWGLVEVAVPGSIPNILVRYWLQLFYLVEVALIAFGFLFASEEVQRFGFFSLFLTLLVHVIVIVFGDVMRAEPGQGIAKTALRSLGGMVLLVVLLLFLAGVLLYLTQPWWLPHTADYLIRWLEPIRANAK